MRNVCNISTFEHFYLKAAANFASAAVAATAGMLHASF